MSLIFPWCDECKNLRDIENMYCCKAYPDGIPSNVLFDTGIREKEECKNGIGYAPKE